MEAVIISKTRMQHAICVGAILADGKGIRLLDINGYNQPFDTKFEIGEIWNLNYAERTAKREPHNEDVLVSASEFKKQRIKNLYRYFVKKLKVKIWQGSSNNLFDGKIRWTNNGSGYISERTGIPEHSVGFFISDTEIKYENKHYIFSDSNHRLAYVGCENPLGIIPKGTLIRVSLARWWKPEDVEMEERCYVQLSGWYLDPSKGKNILIAKWDRSILIEKDYVVGIYFFQPIDNIENLKLGDEIEWLKITEITATKKEGTEVATLNDGRIIYRTEKIVAEKKGDDLPF